jgi:hypothetical protein
MLNIDESGIALSNFQQRIAKAQSPYRTARKGKTDFTIAEFLAEKRADAALEQ